MVLESLLGVAVAAADFRVGRGQVSSTHSGVSRRHTLPRRAVPGERARPRRHVVVAVGGSSPSAVCLLLTVSRAPGLVRLCRVAALYICVGARLRRGVSGARLSSDASPARGGARLLPPLSRTKGTVANQRTVVTGWPGGWRSTRAPATEGARSAASHRYPTSMHRDLCIECSDSRISPAAGLKGAPRGSRRACPPRLPPRGGERVTGEHVVVGVLACWLTTAS